MINLDEVTQGERLELLAELLRQSIGAVPIKDPLYRWALPFYSELIAPGEVKTLQVCPQIAMTVEKLVICETELTRVDITTVVTEERKWWSKIKTSKTDRTSVTVPFPRKNWSIEGAFVGQKRVFPTYGSMPGDLFGPDGELGFRREICPCALYVSLSIKNRSADAASFAGVVLGNIADVKDLNDRPSAVQ